MTSRSSSSATGTSTRRSPRWESCRSTIAAARWCERWGFYNRLLPRERLLEEAIALAAKLAAGPTFAHMMTKTMLHQEWDMSIEAAIEAEAQAQAICMQTEDFRRAYRAFVAKGKPVFEGD